MASRKKIIDRVKSKAENSALIEPELYHASLGLYTIEDIHRNCEVLALQIYIRRLQFEIDRDKELQMELMDYINAVKEALIKT